MILENPNTALANGPKKKGTAAKQSHKRKAHTIQQGHGSPLLSDDGNSLEDEANRVIGKILCYDEKKKRFIPSKAIRVSDCQDQFLLENGHVNRCWTYQLQYGGRLIFYPNFVNRAKCEELIQTVEDNYKTLLRQYRVQNGNEPRLHGLVSCEYDAEREEANGDYQGEGDAEVNGTTGDINDTAATCYNYHGVRMKAQANVKEFGSALQDISDQAARVSQLNSPWNIGCDIILYRNGNDKIGWHADDSQGEQVVFCVVAESPKEPRKLQIRPHRANARLRDGSQEIQLFPAAGDAYVMDGEMQKFYEHSLPQTNCTSRRLALIFRHGIRLLSDSDNGSGAKSLEGRVNLTVEEKHPFGNLPFLVEGAIYSRIQLLENQAVVAIQSGVSGTVQHGCSSIIVSRQSPHKYESDFFDALYYSSTTKQGARSLYTSRLRQNTVRVFRSSDLDNSFCARRLERASSTSPKVYRYDGLYRVKHCVCYDSYGIAHEVNNDLISGDVLYTFKLVRVAAREIPGQEWNKFSVFQFWEETAKRGTMQGKQDRLHLLYQMAIVGGPLVNSPEADIKDERQQLLPPATPTSTIPSTTATTTSTVPSTPPRKTKTKGNSSSNNEDGFSSDGTEHIVTPNYHSPRESDSPRSLQPVNHGYPLAHQDYHQSPQPAYHPYPSYGGNWPRSSQPAYHPYPWYHEPVAQVPHQHAPFGYSSTPVNEPHSSQSAFHPANYFP